jgi:predicted enzyme related to lactoylglutathione lyase
MAKRAAPKTKGGKRRASTKKTPRPPKKAPRRRAAPAPSRKPSPTGRGGVVHWEVQAKDEAMQRAFYAELFGWRIDADNPQHYGVVPAAGPGSIGGGFSQAGPGEPARVTFYVGVPSIEETLAKVVALGGQTTLGRTELGMVVMAQFRDLEGNLIGLVEG